MRTWPATAAAAAFVLLAGCSPAAAPATVAVSSPHSATAVQHDDPHRRRCRRSLAACPDTGRASRSGRLRLGEDLRATLVADTRGDAYVYRPSRHQQADGHHRLGHPRTHARGGRDALCRGGHRVHPPVHAPGRWRTIRRCHPRRLPARLRPHRKRQAAAFAVGRRQAAHGGGRPGGSALIMPYVTWPEKAQVPHRRRGGRAASHAAASHVRVDHGWFIPRCCGWGGAGVVLGWWP
jgi:hypothetical protein